MIKNKIDQILSSISNIKIVKTKPYFYTRLSTKIASLNYKEKIYIKYERPILITTVIALLIINSLFIFNNINDTNNSVQYTLEEIYFESDKSDLINLASYEE